MPCLEERSGRRAAGWAELIRCVWLAGVFSTGCVPEFGDGEFRCTIGGTPGQCPEGYECVARDPAEARCRRRGTDETMLSPVEGPDAAPRESASDAGPEFIERPGDDAAPSAPVQDGRVAAIQDGAADAEVFVDAAPTPDVADTTPPIPKPQPDGDGGLKCTQGYAAVGSTCADINECAEGSSGCAHGCENSAGAFRCTCRPMHKLEADGRTCREFNWEVTTVSHERPIEGFALTKFRPQGVYLTWAQDCAIRRRAFDQGAWVSSDEPLTRHLGCARGPLVSIDASEQALTAWIESPASSPEQTPKSVWAVRGPIAAGPSRDPVQLDPGAFPVTRLLAVQCDGSEPGADLVLWSKIAPDPLFGARSSGDFAGSAMFDYAPYWNSHHMLIDVSTALDASGRMLVVTHEQGYFGTQQGEHKLVSQTDVQGAAMGTPGRFSEATGTIMDFALAMAPSRRTGWAVWSQVVHGAGVSGVGAVKAQQYVDDKWTDAIETVGSGGGLSEVAVAVNDAGVVVAAWVDSDSFQVAVRDQNGWSHQDLTRWTPATARVPRVAIDPMGSILVLWSASNYVYGVIRPAGESTFRPAGSSPSVGRGGVFTSPVADGGMMVDPRPLNDLQLLLLDSGEAFAAWTGCYPGHNLCIARFR